MKRAVLVAMCLILMVTCALCACACAQGGHYTVVMSVSEQDSHSFSMSYERFNGYRYYTIDISDPVTLTVWFETKGGNLDYTITNADGEQMFGNQGVTTSGFSVSLAPGKYRVTLTATDHQGSYSFKW